MTDKTGLILAIALMVIRASSTLYNLHALYHLELAILVAGSVYETYQVNQWRMIDLLAPQSPSVDKSYRKAPDFFGCQ